MNLNEICLEIGTLPHQVGKTLLTNAVKHRVNSLNSCKPNPRRQI